MSLGETALKSVMHEHAFLVSVLPKMSVVPCYDVIVVHWLSL